MILPPMTTKAKLVQTYTNDNILLSGLFIEGNVSKAAVIHIHGWEGDFFTNKFIHTIGDSLAKKNHAFLTVQTRGMGKIYEFYSKGSGIGKVIGGDNELLEEAYVDIDAWVKFLHSKGYLNIILQGHSLGTLKVVRYLFEGKYKKSIKALILLCPFDKNVEIMAYTKGKLKNYLQKAKKKILEGKSSDLIPKKYAPIDLSYQTYISWYDQTDLGRMFDLYNKDYDFPTLRKINIPVHIIVGSKDEYFYLKDKSKYKEAFELMLMQIKKGSGSLIQGATHSFNGYEDNVTKSIQKFLGSIK